jgi:hypothetical protein
MSFIHKIAIAAMVAAVAMSASIIASPVCQDVPQLARRYDTFCNPCSYPCDPSSYSCGYPYGSYGSSFPYSTLGYGYSGCYPGSYGYAPYFSSANRFNANDNNLHANTFNTAFNSHQNEADHIANSDVNAFTTANNVCADNHCVSSANRNTVI